MKKKIKFNSILNIEGSKKFASFSGDKNKIHYDINFAKKTKFKKPIAHGAYLIALMSRIAGMEIPGKNAIVNSYEIFFKKPIYLPCKIVVQGELVTSQEVSVKFYDFESNILYAEGSYIFSLSSLNKQKKIKKIDSKKKLPARTFITGATGDMGKILHKGLKGSIKLELKKSYYHKSLIRYKNKFSVKNIIHCGWPSPDNQSMLSDNNTNKLIDYYIKKPIEDIIEIAKFLKKNGNKYSKLILIGSTFSKPGRHNFKYPYYSLGKSSLKTINEIISLELGKFQMSSVIVEFDIIDGGMNSSLNAAQINQASDRSPSGQVPNMTDIVKEIRWVLKNNSYLINGSTIKLTGGNLP